VDLVVAPDLSSWKWKDEAEYAHVRRLGIVTEHRAVDDACARDTRGTHRPVRPRHHVDVLAVGAGLAGAAPAVSGPDRRLNRWRDGCQR
jgi:hypothetical protein